MRMHLSMILSSLALLGLGVLALSPSKADACKKKKAKAPEAASILLAPWVGPHGGVPPFDKVKVEEFKPALEASMAEALDEMARLGANPEAPTFENTVAAYERVGRAFGRVYAIWGVHGANLSSPEFQVIEQEMEPLIAQFRDRIMQDEAFFKRLSAVYDAMRKDSGKLGLTPEQQRLTWLHYTTLARSGALLDTQGKQRLTEINQRLARLFTDFRQNVLFDEENGTLWISDEAGLAGLPDSVKNAAAMAAEEKGHKGEWAIMNTRSSVEPFLTWSSRRDLREQVWRNFVMRGNNGGEHDNNAIVAEILQLRLERARLLGYETHAHWKIEMNMAKTPEASLKLMEEMWVPARARVQEEVRDMAALAAKEGANITIEPWDYRHYAEKVRKDRFDVDENAVKPYLQLDKLREGMFWAAEELFGYRFTPVQPGTVPVFHPEVQVWSVNMADGKPLGLFYFDPYARNGKLSGAWMTQYRNQERFDGEILTLVSNNSNFVRGQPGEPVLLSWDDATTLFHEFGHALHGLSSNVTYPGVSGTSVPSDYVELPSQILEHWLPEPRLLDRYALHFETGLPMPKDLVEKVEKASNFNQGFFTLEFLASALVDMKLHMDPNPPTDIQAAEKRILDQLGMPREIVMRHRTTQFNHLFSSDDYSAGYYSYLWADTLVADAWEAFEQAPGGAWDKELAGRLYANVFSVGNIIDPAEGYRAFRGKDPTFEALMRQRGFAPPAPKAP